MVYKFFDKKPTSFAGKSAKGSGIKFFVKSTTCR